MLLKMVRFLDFLNGLIIFHYISLSVYLYTPWLLYSFIHQWTQCCFHVFNFINNAAINMEVQISFQVDVFHLIHFELVFFEWCMKGIQFQWFHVWLANHPSTINGRDFLFSIEYSWIPCQVLADHKDMLWFISGISILFHWSIFIAVHTLLITIAL